MNPLAKLLDELCDPGQQPHRWVGKPYKLLADLGAALPIDAYYDALRDGLDAASSWEVFLEEFWESSRLLNEKEEQ